MSKVVVVIGAGICGAACALWLRRSGHDVLLLDKSEPGMGASYGNAGLLAQWAIVPMNEPGIWKNLPRYLLDPIPEKCQINDKQPHVRGACTAFIRCC